MFRGLVSPRHARDLPITSITIDVIGGNRYHQSELTGWIVTPTTGCFRSRTSRWIDIHIDRVFA
jgi:hypothetical protein